MGGRGSLLLLSFQHTSAAILQPFQIRFTPIRRDKKKAKKQPAGVTAAAPQSLLSNDYDTSTPAFANWNREVEMLLNEHLSGQARNNAAPALKQAAAARSPASPLSGDGFCFVFFSHRTHGRIITG